MVSPRIQRRGCCNLAALSCSLHFRGSILVQTICSSGKHPFKSSVNLLLLLLSSLPTLFASFQAFLHTHTSPRSSQTASLAPPVGFGAPRELIPRDWRALQGSGAGPATSHIPRNCLEQGCSGEAPLGGSTRQGRSVCSHCSFSPLTFFKGFAAGGCKPGWDPWAPLKRAGTTGRQVL